MTAAESSGEPRIRDIIETHNQLAQSYRQIMTVIQKQRFFFCFQQQAQPAENAKRPNVVVSILWTFLILYECLYSYRVRAEKAYIIRPFVKYFLESHIRRQYQKLHDLYLSEFVAQRQPNEEEADIRELRQIASDIENYSKTLSHRKGLGKLLQALPYIGTIFALFGVTIPLPEFLSQASLVEAILRGFVSGHILIGLTLCPLIAAFHLKRLMFENSITMKIQNYSFTGGHESKLYPRSVYLLENRLYELLGGMEQKPKEVPIDILMRIGFGSFVVALSLTLSMLVVSGYIQPDSTDGNNNNDLFTTTIDEILGPIALTGSVYVAFPIMNYIQRRKSRLL